MAAPLTRRLEGDDTSPQVILAATGPAEYVLPTTGRGVSAQVSAVLGLLAGVWVAVSPWFITLQYHGSNAPAVDLITGLVAAVGAFALASPRGFPGLQAGLTAAALHRSAQR
jgi:SPW repeat